MVYTSAMVKKLISKADLTRLAGVTAAAVTKAVAKNLKAAMVGKRIDANHPSVVKYIADHTRAPTPEPATGIDPLYEQAVEWCAANGRYTKSNIVKGLRVGQARADRILNMMKAAGVEQKVVMQPPRGQEAKTTRKKRDALDKLNNTDTGTMIHEIPDDINAFVDMTLREIISRYGTDVAFVDWLRATKSIEDINEKRLKNAVTQGSLVSRELVKVGVIDPFNAAHMKLLTDGAKTITRRVTAMHTAGRSLEDCEAFVVDQISSFIRPVKSKVARALKNA